ncbi:MAG TPA: ATP-binding protein, partial [Acidimicrobiales bacterium]|nr:ATP-binding protein [Acidimicrobiales bacterium]
RVTDRGPGIPRERREEVFTPFQSQGDGQGRGRQGLGLGLAVAKGFVEAMGGNLMVEDTPGGGATFVFSLESATASQATPAGADTAHGGANAIRAAEATAVGGDATPSEAGMGRGAA